MAICDFCDLEMTTARTCTVDALHHKGIPTPLRPYGQERGMRARSGRCGDCGARVGGFHHLGCDLQQCPRCGDQRNSCGCLWDEFIRDYLVTGYLYDYEGDELAELLLYAFDRLVAVASVARRALSGSP